MQLVCRSRYGKGNACCERYRRHGASHLRLMFNSRETSTSRI